MNTPILPPGIAYIGIAVFSLPVALATLVSLRVLGPRNTRVAVPLIMAAGLLWFHSVARPGGGLLMTSFYILVPLAFGVLFSVTWLVLPEVMHRAPRGEITRAYGLVGASSILGGTAGGAMARLIAARIDPQQFLLAGCAFLLLAAAAVGLTHVRYPATLAEAEGSARAPCALDFWCVVRHPYSLLLVSLGMAGAFTSTLIEFQFYLAAAASGQGGRESAEFFAGFYLLLNALGLVVQLFLMARIQRRIGTHGSLLILPVVLLGGTGALLVSASMLPRSLLRIVESGLKMSIHKTNWEHAFVPMGAAHRSAAKLLVDGMGIRIAEGLAAAVLFLWARSLSTPAELGAPGLRWLTVLLLVAITVWIALAALLRGSLAPIDRAASETGTLRPEIPLPDS